MKKAENETITNMIEKLETKQSRKMFFVLIGLLLITIFLIQHLLIPYMKGIPIIIDSSILENILDKLFISVLVTVGLASFIFWLNPRNKKNAQMKILQPVEIGQNFVDARNKTQRWWFNGSSGRYTRSITLPSLADACRRDNKQIEVVIQMLNPNNNELCEAYANYRNALRTASKSNSKRTLKSVQQDLLATIVSAYMWKTEQPQLNIKVGLKDHFSLFRIDLSTNKAIITKEDPIEPAILYESGTFFYDAYYNDLVQTLNQAKSLNMSIGFVTESQLSAQNVKELIDKLELSSNINDKDISIILELVKDKRNPYSA